MKVPGILVGVALIVVALLAPAAGPKLHAVPAGVVGMGHEGYEIDGVHGAHLDKDGVPVITVRVGTKLTFQNDSLWIHVVGPGRDGLLAPPGGSSMTARLMMQQNDTYTTPAWTTPGTYRITCTVHPDMNATIVVVG